MFFCLERRKGNMVKTGEEEKRVTGKQREEITEAWEVVVVKMYLKY